MPEETEQVGTEEITEEKTEESQNEMRSELDRLRQENADQQIRINKYDGERSDMSNKMNNLESMMEELKATKTTTIDEGEGDELVTKAELAEYRKGETGRFEKFNQSKQDENSEYNKKYTEGFANASIDVNDESLTEILKEHDALQGSGKMPKSTGDPALDAQRAYEKAENVFLKKRLAAGGGEVKSFNKEPASAKLGVGSTNLGNDVVKETKSMPKLPADAQALMNDLGENADFANEVLGKR